MLRLWRLLSSRGRVRGLMISRPSGTGRSRAFHSNPSIAQFRIDLGVLHPITRTLDRCFSVSSGLSTPIWLGQTRLFPRARLAWHMHRFRRLPGQWLPRDT